MFSRPKSSSRWRSSKTGVLRSDTATQKLIQKIEMRVFGGSLFMASFLFTTFFDVFVLQSISNVFGSDCENLEEIVETITKNKRNRNENLQHKYISKL